MRAAIYFTPPEDAELTRLAAAWLGRDAFADRATRSPDAMRDRLVAEAARYGFHATLKAPFRLDERCSLDDVSEALRAFAAERPEIAIERLALRSMDGFFALVPAEPEPAIAELEADIVRAFEPFRAALTPGEFAKRRPERLSVRQRRYLETYGYPFVLDEFRFHMTLTGRVEANAEAVETALLSHFAPILDAPLRLGALALFVEPTPGAPFHVHACHAFSSQTAES